MSITPVSGLKIRGADSEKGLPYRSAEDIPNNCDTSSALTCCFVSLEGCRDDQDSYIALKTVAMVASWYRGEYKLR